MASAGLRPRRHCTTFPSNHFRVELLEHKRARQQSFSGFGARLPEQPAASKRTDPAGKDDGGGAMRAFTGVGKKLGS